MRCINLNEVYSFTVYRQQKSSKKFSDRFRARAARLGLQANEIAERIGVEPGAVSNWMNGTNPPKPKNLRQLADLLGCEMDWLMGLDVAEPMSPGELRESMDSELLRWQRRALAAEHKIDVIRAVVGSMASSPANDAPGAMLNLAESQVDSASSSAPTGQKSPPSPGVSPETKLPPAV